MREDSRRVGIIQATAGLLSAALKEGSLWIGASLVTAGLVLMLLSYLEDENDESRPVVSCRRVVRRHAAI